jgi:hypothetical protein
MAAGKARAIAAPAGRLKLRIQLCEILLDERPGQISSPLPG